MIIQIAAHLPKTVIGNEELAQLYPDWTAEKIFEKTGIRERHVVLEGECASDLAFAAAERLFAGRALQSSAFIVERRDVSVLAVSKQALM